MPAAKRGGSGSRRVFHSWTIDQRRCVLLLFGSRFHLDTLEGTAIWNKVFEAEIDSRDFPTGVPGKSVRSQYNERNQADNVSWSQILRPQSWVDENHARDALAERIDRALNTRRSAGHTSVSPAETHAYPSPKPSPRKRKRTVFEDIDVEEGPSSPMVSTGSTSRRRASIVLIDPSEAGDRAAHLVVDEAELLSPPRTPVKQTKTALLSPPAAVHWVRRSGPALQVSVKIAAEIEKGYSPPSEAEAHPPLAGLFYRFWDPNESQGYNSDRGFIAKRYVRSNAVPVRAYVPPAMHLDPTDLFNHLNEEKESTPFVSVSDSLVWSLNKFLKLVKSGAWKAAKLSVIDSSQLVPGSVFYAAGFYRQLKRIRSFTKNAQRGVSSHEFLIWRDVPESALIRTLDVGELMASTAASRELTTVLRLDTLSAIGPYQTSIRQKLQQGQVEVTTAVALCFAKLALLLGLSATSTFEHHRHLVNDLTASYKMVVSYHEPEEWRNIAAHYCHTICRQSESPVSAKDQAVLKLAFLEGVRLGASFDFKMSRIDARTVQSLQRKARLIGLEDPGRIVSGEADAVKIHVAVEQQRQWKLFDLRPSQLLLEDGADVDAGSVFEMDEDGIVL